MDQGAVRPEAPILIVEDEMIVASEAERILTELGYDSAGIVTSGEGVLQMMEEARPDLVLVYIRLQRELDGVETAARAHGRRDVAAMS